MNKKVFYIIRFLNKVFGTTTKQSANILLTILKDIGFENMKEKKQKRIINHIYETLLTLWLKIDTCREITNKPNNLATKENVSHHLTCKLKIIINYI